jgi:glycosyltransferase involved in cell wall biosynthesis
MVAYSEYSSDARVKNYVDALLDAKWRVHIVSLTESPKLSNTDHVAFHQTVHKYQGDSIYLYLWSYFRFFLISCLHLTKLCFMGECQIVHVHNMPNCIVFAALIPRLFGSRIILDFHDTMPELYMEKFRIGKQSLMCRVLLLEETLSAMLAHELIVTSEVHKKIFLEHGLPSRNMAVVMNLANPRYFTFEHEHAHTTQEAFRFIYHGTLSHRSGLDIALRAFKLAVNRCRYLQLSIIGDGDYRSTLLNLSKQLELDDCVTFSEGLIAVEQLSWHITHADAGLIPSRSDGATASMLPVKLLEYVYMRKPSIVARTTGVQYYFDDAMVCYFDPENVSDLADKIVRVSSDVHYRQSLVDNANRFNDMYNWEAQKHIYLGVIRRGWEDSREA